MSTGNYNTVTATLYTDLGLFTCDDDIGADATDLFNYLTGYSAKTDYRKLLVAPINLREPARELDPARDQASKGRCGDGHIIFKLNSLVDRQMIKLLYQASQAGVRVDLIVRGMCCLRPGVPGVSDNIRVTSIVGRFLEHSRIFYFRNGGAEEVYLGSADLMPRNLDRRVEVLFPVRDPRACRPPARRGPRDLPRRQRQGPPDALGRKLLAPRAARRRGADSTAKAHSWRTSDGEAASDGGVHVRQAGNSVARGLVPRLAASSGAKGPALRGSRQPPAL